MTNAPDSIDVRKLDAPLGAEIAGIDFANPVPEETKALLRQAWSDNLILVFRGQSHISQADHLEASRVFGEAVVGAKMKFFKKSGVKVIHQAESPEISVVANTDENGVPVMENQGLGSGEVVWHSDNSYAEEPPVGSFLIAREIPEDGGSTSWNNQYLAYETLPEGVKQRIEGQQTKQDSSRNSNGRLRPGMELPTCPEDVPGPNHPIVRVVPETGRKALYLGRRRDYPSQYIVGWSRKDSEEMLDFLWNHATDPGLKYTHDWEVGDMVLWDNRCTMHYREALTTLQRRILHRTQVRREKPIMA